jgi:hypothetical protein
MLPAQGNERQNAEERDEPYSAFFALDPCTKQHPRPSHYNNSSNHAAPGFVAAGSVAEFGQKIVR